MPTRADRIGTVYAIITKKGYALGQIAGIGNNGVFHCRIFSKLYNDIPADIGSIVSGKEDYIVQIEMQILPKVSMAIKLGKYGIPADFSKPKFVRFTLGEFAFGGKPSLGNFNQWMIKRAYTADIVFMKDWLSAIDKDKNDESWKEDFLKLNPSSVYGGPILISMLETGWSLDKWRPLDFNKSVRELNSTLDPRDWA